MITCLSIDDDPMFQKLIEAYFAEFDDLELIGKYTNPIDGALAVVKQKPHVLLIDYEMPYMDGFDILETLDKRPFVIVISGHATQKDCDDFPLQIDGFISKNELEAPAILYKKISDLFKFST